MRLAIPRVLRPRVRAWFCHVVLALAGLFAAASASATVTTLAYYRMGETENGTPGSFTTTTPDSIGGNNLSLPGGPFYSADVGVSAVGGTGSRRSLDFFSGNIGIFGQATLSTTATANVGLEAWARAYNTTGSEVVAYNGTISNGFGLVRVGNQWRAQFGGVAQFGSAPVVVNQWTHLAVVQFEGAASFYVDGALVGQTTSASLPATGSFSVASAAPFASAVMFDGLIDEVRVFSFASGQFQPKDLLLFAPEIAIERPALSELASGSSVDYGSLAMGTAQVRSFSTRNVGPGPLQLDGVPRVAISGANASDFNVTVQPGANVGATTRLNLSNRGFETPVLAAGGSTAAPVGAGWTFGSQAGIARNGSPFYVVNAPEGAQAAYIQTVGASAAQSFISQTVQVPASVQYVVRFRAARRAQNQANDLVVRIDGVTIGTVSRTVLDEASLDNEWRQFVFGFTPGVGPHVLTIAGTRTGGDFTTVVDNVEVQQLTNILNSGFETPVLAAGGWVAAPTNAIWTFSSNAGIADTSTIQSPRFQYRMEGKQAAWIAGVASISESRSFSNVGSHIVRFKLARAASSSANRIDVQFDGQVIGTVAEAGQLETWAEYAFPAEVDDVGTHSLKFQGTSAGAAVIDDVDVQYRPTTTFDVEFRPTAGFTRNATLQVSNNDTDEDPYVLALTGGGTGPDIVLEQPVGTGIVTGGSRSFGTAVLGQSPQLTFTISNNGTTPTVGNLAATMVGTDASVFLIARKPAISASAGSPTTVSVMFDTSTLGTKNATLRIASNDGDENPFDINVSGALAATPDIGVDQPAGTSIIDGGNATFPPTGLGSNSSLAFTVLNFGTVPLNLTGTPRVTIDGANAGDFSVTTLPSATLPAAIPVRNAGFEAPALDAGTSTLDPPATGFRWQFASEIGVATNGSGWFANPAPQGGQAALIRKNGAPAVLSQVLTVPGAGSFQVRFDSVLPQAGTPNDIRVQVGSDAVGTVSSSALTSAWKTFAFPYTSPSAGALTLSLTGLQANGVTPIDAVQVPSTSAMQVRFTPGAAGMRTATLHITSNDADEASYDIVLNGTGVGPEIAVEQPAGSDIVDGATRGFGNVQAGASTALVFTVRNTSAATPLSGIVPTIDGADASSFSFTSLPASSLAPGASTTFGVRFEPLSAGSKTAALHIASNDADENPFDVVLQGTGVATVEEIGLDQPVGVGLADGGSRSFPATPIGTPVTLDFSIYNTGNASVALTGTPRVQVSGANAAEFVVLAQPPASLGGAPTLRNRGFEEPVLPGGQNVYAPAFAGWTFGATAAIARNPFVPPPPQGAQGAYLDADSASPGQGFIAQAIAFPAGNHLIRFAAARNPTLFPPTGIDIRIDGITIGTLSDASLPDATWRTFSFPYLSPSPATRTLTLVGTRPGGFFRTAIDQVEVATSASFQVQFTPTAAGLRSAALTIANTDADENPYNVALTGTSTGPDIAVEQPAGLSLADGEARNLGSVILGNNTTMTFTIRNTGTTSLTGLAVTVDGPDFTFFQPTALPASLAPGASTTLDIFFSPFDARTYNGTLHIASNDVDESPFDIPLAANGVQANISVLQGGTPIGDGSLSSFGIAIPLGQTRTVSYAIGNNGVGQDLTGIGVSITGTDASMFAVTTVPATAAAPGEFNPLVVTFTPTATGTRTATMTIVSSDPDESPYTLFLEGQVVAPEIVIEQPAGSNVPDGGARSFGNVALGANASLTFTIRNTGNGPLTGIVPTLGGPDAGQFTVTQAPPVTLGGLLSNIFIVRFTPAAQGPASATLQLANSDTDENPFDIALTGTGTTPEIDVEQPAGTPLGDGDERDFGELRVGASATLSFVVRNTGLAADLTGVGATISGPGASAYSVTTAPASTVAAGGNTTLVVTYTPTASGTFDATLAIASSDSDENPYDIALRGSAIDPEIVVEQPAGTNVVDGQPRDFGDVNVGGIATLEFAIRNTGTTPLTGVLATITGAGAASFGVATVPEAVIAPGASTTLVLRFAPDATGARAATLQIASNDADENPFDVSLAGRGTVAEIDLEQPAGSSLASGSARSFGQVDAGSSATLGFVVRNTGFAQQLIGLDVSITGAGASAFTVTNAPTGSLAAGGSAPFDVVFAPTAAGTFDATLVVASSDADEDPYEIALSGLAVAVLADLQVGKSNGEGTLLPTRDTIYTVQVLNAGPASVPSVRVVDDLPASFSNVQWTCVSSPAGLCPAPSGAGDVDETTSLPLANGAMLEYAIVARPSGAPGTLVTNTASAQIVGGGVTDSDGSNNTASDTDPIVGDSIFFGGFENPAILLRPRISR